MSYLIRPISDVSRFKYGGLEQSRFKADLDATKKLLEKEVENLDGHDLVVEVDVEPADILTSGAGLKPYARPMQPGVVVMFESTYGPLVYATDRFNDWRANLRAIALSLESLRAVDRYGVSGRGEQYTGWAQIEAGPAGSSDMTKTAAAQLLERVAIGEDLGPARDREVARIAGDPAHARKVLREARAVTHPDRNGDRREAWDQVEQAAKVLGVLS